MSTVTFENGPRTKVFTILLTTHPADRGVMGLKWPGEDNPTLDNNAKNTTPRKKNSVENTTQCNAVLNNADNITQCNAKTQRQTTLRIQRNATLRRDATLNRNAQKYNACP